MLLRFAVKWFFDAAVTITLLIYFTNATVTQMILAATVFSLIAFGIGDQIVLRKTGNGVATIADIGMAGLYFWLLSYYFNWRMTAWEIIITAVVIGIVEYMYHIVLIKWDKNSNMFSYRDLENK